MVNWKEQHKTESSKKVFDKGLFTIFEDEIRLPDGKRTTYYRREAPPFSVAVPRLKEGFVMVRQYRHGVGEDSLEFPMGHVAGQDGDVAAHIELKEETGYSAGTMVEIGKCVISASKTNTRMSAYLAEGLTPGNQKLEESEFVTVEIHSEKDVENMIDTGEIFDANTIAAFYFYKRYQEKRES